ncbi:protein kinase [Solirubrobacter taibaiensis]|nr:protein kinase [Solirubrobacter taibaiensis]
MGADRLEPGATVAGYRIESLLGRGGMGVVYCARELELDRLVALKVISPALVEDPAIRARFLREARAAAAVEHPNVIPIHAAAARDDIAFIAMRLVDGEDLRRRVRRFGALTPGEASKLLEQAAAGLDAIHGAGFVHRDVKPANLLIDRTGHLYVTDFGLVKQALSQSGATTTGQWVGTLDYVAPEQIRGGRVDARADIYALGGVLFFALTGKVPFDRTGDEAKLWAQLSEPAPAPTAYRPELPIQFDGVVARAMHKATDARYPSAGDLARAARAAAAGGFPAEPERMIARGAAAPEGAPQEPGLAPESVTVSAARQTELMAPEPAPRTRRWALAAVASGAAAAAAAVMLLLDGEPSARGGAVVAPIATATPVARVVSVTRDVGDRPGAIAYAAGDLWVGSRGLTRLTRIDAATGVKRREQPHVGRGTVSVEAHGDVVWVAVADSRRVIGIDARTGEIIRRIPLDGEPLRLRADADGVWVLMRPVKNHGQLVRRFSASGRERAPFRLRRKHSALETGAGSVWLYDAARQGITRLDAQTGQRKQFIKLLGRRATLTFAAGHLWVVILEAGIGHRIKPDGGRMSFNAGHTPAQAWVFRGRLYIAARDEHRVLVLDLETREHLGEIAVEPNPTAFGSDGRSLWVTGLAENTVSRILPR